MKTNFEAGVIDTKGYDVIAELEDQNLKEYLIKRREEAAQKARQYLAENPKKVYYCMTGYPTDVPWDEVPEQDFCSLISYTNEEVERLKQLIVEVWNMDAEPENQINSYDELDPDCNLDDLRGCNSELDQLLWERAEKQDFALSMIDLNTPLHAYLFSGYRYDVNTQTMDTHRYYRRVVLTDEEYLYLLTEHVNNRYFTFNRLLLVNAPLAQKICAATEDVDSTMVASTDPHLILMDEVASDMEAIIGSKK